MVIIMKRIQGRYENTIVIQKSKFIAEAYRVNSVEEIESRTGLVVLGATPNIDAARNSRNGGHYGD